MRKIIYYVAASVDGYIAGPGGDASNFLAQGEGVTRYLNDLASFDTVIMGRKTYEFGYQYGLVPGQPAYPHMEHYIFSSSLNIKDLSPQVHICPPNLDILRDLKADQGSPIYLCGGGEFAAWLLEAQLIDQVIIKLNPIIMGEGIRLFGHNTQPLSLKTVESTFYSDDGLQIIAYDILYS